MIQISSVKNEYIKHLSLLSSDRNYRYSCGEFFCEGIKPLRDCLDAGLAISSVLWRGEPALSLDCDKQYCGNDAVFDKASSMKNSPGPVFTVRIPADDTTSPLEKVLILENVQDPGNVGTVLRTANALGIGCVILAGDCADKYNPKCTRASMGAVFRQRTICCSVDEAIQLCRKNGLSLFAAALDSESMDIRSLGLSSCAVAIGNEGNGLSAEMLRAADSKLIIPMKPYSESLNAAVAASLFMWEMVR